MESTLIPSRPATWRKLSAKQIGVIAAGVVAVLAICGFAYWENQSSTRDLKVGFSAFEPYVTVDQGQKPGGLAAEMITRASRNAGISIHWVLVTGDIEEALQSGKSIFIRCLQLRHKDKENFTSANPGGRTKSR